MGPIWSLFQFSEQLGLRRSAASVPIPRERVASLPYQPQLSVDAAKFPCASPVAAPKGASAPCVWSCFIPVRGLHLALPENPPGSNPSLPHTAYMTVWSRISALDNVPHLPNSGDCRTLSENENRQSCNHHAKTEQTV